MRKILYSPEYGAGWTSWADDKMRPFMLEYQPIIEFLENGGGFSSADCGNPGNGNAGCHPVLRKFLDECQERFGDTPYIGGAVNLRVMTVSGMVRIDDYDGFESVTEEGDDSGWI